MTQYLVFLAFLTVIYIGYLIVQARQRKRMMKYYGYSRRRNINQIKKAA